MACWVALRQVLLGAATAAGPCPACDAGSATSLLQLRSGAAREAAPGGGSEAVFLEGAEEVPSCWTRQSTLPPYDGGIFATCTGNDMRLCYHRHKYNERQLDRVKGEHETENAVIGEDPRIFEFNGKTYILDNMANDMHLIEIDARSGDVLARVPIFISATKNVSPVVKGDHLYFIDFEGEQLFTASLRETGVNARAHQDIKIVYDTSTECKNMPTPSLQSCFLRGGTPGVKLRNKWVGMGHCTSCDQYDPTDKGSCMGHKGHLTHTTFAWTTHDLRSIRVKPLCLQNSQNVADPTTLWTNPWRLVTAESDDQWMSGSQTYSTVMYEPCGKNKTRAESKSTNSTTKSEAAVGLAGLHERLTTFLQERYQDLYQVVKRWTPEKEPTTEEGHSIP